MLRCVISLVRFDEDNSLCHCQLLLSMLVPVSSNHEVQTGQSDHHGSVNG